MYNICTSVISLIRVRCFIQREVSFGRSTIDVHRVIANEVLLIKDCLVRTEEAPFHVA